MTTADTRGSTAVEVRATPRSLTVERRGAEPVELPAVALRDRCPCTDCRHPGGQRLLDPVGLGDHIAIRTVTVDGPTVTVVWEPDGHVSTFGVADLGAASAPADRRDRWDAGLGAGLAVAEHDLVVTDRSALAAWLDAVDRLGVGILRGVPVVDGEVARVAELFAHVRVTNYGRYFDVRSVADPANLANSALGLPVHTDNPYRDPVPTLQLLHCLSSSTAGGDNVVVDGLHVAEVMGEADPSGFAALTEIPVEFAYADDTGVLGAVAPLIELDVRGVVRAVRCNSRSMRSPLGAADELERWYEAYGRWARMLADERFQVRFRLDPGDLFIVDNRRVLHGRTAFEPTAGARHLQGCYADIDGLRSTLALLTGGRS